MAQILKSRQELELLFAPTAEVGFELIEKECVDLILMDINLPGMSGVEALQLLKQNPETAAIPVVALSANAMPADIEAGIEAGIASGFVEYLTKPVDVSVLLNSIDRSLSEVSRRH
ncbi:response regulator [Solemya pervernicosa gill symbiont]|uniref:response regulator n=1 Tax=Solemya pervernicosa gill symbiont TaxID=642797 RepID=UPI0015607712|nr:response regulator [Solemya pervernicosa gill symbiont]